MIGRRALLTLVVLTLVAASCASDPPEESVAPPEPTPGATTPLGPDPSAESTEPTDSDEPVEPELAEPATVDVPAGLLYLPSELPDGWTIRSVRTFATSNNPSRDLPGLSFIAHPSEGGYEVGGITVEIIRHPTEDEAASQVEAGFMGHDATSVEVAGFGSGIAETDPEQTGFSTLAVSHGTIAVRLVGRSSVDELLSIAEGLQIGPDVDAVSDAELTVEFDLAGWELVQVGTDGGYYDIEVGGPGGTISVGISSDSARASLYLSGRELVQVLEGDVGEGYLAVQRIESEGIEFPRIMWWVPDVLLRGTPTSDPDLVVQVLESFVEVDEATFVAQTANASFIQIEPSDFEAPEPSPDAPGDPTPQRPFDDARLDVLATFVEDFFGRSFDDPPEVSLIDPANFVDMVPPGTFVTESQWSLYRALGLVPARADRADAETVRIEAIRGVCCPVQIVEQADPNFTEVVIAHELAHGLDTALNVGAGSASEPVSPSRALVEGNAHRAAFAYRGLLEAAGVELDDPGVVPADDPRLPDAIRELFEFPYEEGRWFATAIAEHGGEQAIIAAFVSPPTTSEQILEPDKYLSGQGAATVETPNVPAGEESLSSGSIGAFTLRLLLEESLDPDAAEELTSTWAGDRYRLYGDPAAPCIVATIVVDDEASAEALVAALGDAAIEVSSNDVTHEGTSVRLSRCAA